MALRAVHELGSIRQRHPLIHVAVAVHAADQLQREPPRNREPVARALAVGAAYSAAHRAIFPSELVRDLVALLVLLVQAIIAGESVGHWAQCSGW